MVATGSGRCVGAAVCFASGMLAMWLVMQGVAGMARASSPVERELGAEQREMLAEQVKAARTALASVTGQADVGLPVDTVDVERYCIWSQRLRDSLVALDRAEAEKATAGHLERLKKLRGFIERRSGVEGAPYMAAVVEYAYQQALLEGSVRQP